MEILAARDRVARTGPSSGASGTAGRFLFVAVEAGAFFVFFTSGVPSREARVEESIFSDARRAARRGWLAFQEGSHAEQHRAYPD